ncbi:ArgE/DapE family deacylase [Bombiscardovia coagulans]|uniref:Probable succinyl-diaminopimelate desuccinylase n=1 Tax=Bombiscardovia coagulans TaxID=686666 RepID=A0A261EQ48_9BIFI|nr:ArgE/DapE family deacylase [Bombiscardovia coagulans]OZG48980.1 peptidase M20 [Bombiscardovia coagulans]
MSENEKLDLLRKLVAFKTINGHELPVAEFIQSLLTKEGITSEIVPTGDDRADLVATMGSGHPVLAICGHMDVVDVNTSNWHTDPFTVTPSDDGDTLYGRGTTDMKSGLAAMLIAMIEMKRKNTPLKGSIKLLVTSGEEVGQLGAEILQDKGYMDDVDALLIGEPSGYIGVYASKGELDVRVKATGVAAHSSMPELGVNAVEAMLQVLQKIKEELADRMQKAHNAVLGDTVFNIDTFHGGNQVNAIPASAEAEINIRVIPELPNDEILKTIQATIDSFNSSSKAQISMDVEMNIIPVIGDKDSRLIQLAQKLTPAHMARLQQTPANLKHIQTAEKTLGVTFNPDKLLLIGVSGATDASKLLINHPEGFSFLVFGPGTGSVAHQDNEYVSKAAYLDFIDLYQELFSAYLS